MDPAHHNDAVPQPVPLLDVSFDSRSDAHSALLALVSDQSPVMSCFSADFSGWPLQQPGFIRQLQQWALRDPKRPAALRMLALDWSAVRQRFARFSAFRRDFAYLVDCRQISETQARGLHEMLWTPHGAVYAHTATWMSGERVRSATRLHALQRRFE
ncbi:MAG: hypothetical protein B7Z83_10000, partial [Thiomonas sp. 20-64-5]